MKGMRFLSVLPAAAAARRLAARLSGRAHAFQRSITVGGTSLARLLLNNFFGAVCSCALARGALRDEARHKREPDRGIGTRNGGARNPGSEAAPFNARACVSNACALRQFPWKPRLWRRAWA